MSNLKPSKHDTKYFNEDPEGSVHKALMRWELQVPLAVFFGVVSFFFGNNDWEIIASFTTVICFVFSLMFLLFHGIGLLIVGIKGVWNWFINLV